MTGRAAAVAVADPVHVGVARSRAVAVAREAGLAGAVLDRVAVVASELASNLVKFAVGGLLTVERGPNAVDVLATDRGPGIEHVADALRDGYSTTGTLGGGLGAVHRMADEFDLYTREGQGTTVLARWWLDAEKPSGPRVGSASFVAPGEDVSGDAWVLVERNELVTVVVVDGLGHGRPAADAADAVVGEAATDPARPPAELLTTLDRELSGTRGAAVAIAQFDTGRSTVSFQALGNITTRLFPAGGRRETLLSAPGIVGRRQSRIRRIAPTVRPWPAGSLLIMHTDGVSGRWDEADWPGVLEHDPATVAGWLLGQHCRRRDDACVVVLAGGDPS